MADSTETKVVIFGGSSRIAQGAAKVWAQNGAEIYLVGRDPEKLKVIARDLQVRGAKRVLCAAVDLSHPERHQLLIEEIEREFGAFNTVLIAFGTLPDSQALDVDPNQILENFRVNLLAPAMLAELSAKRLAEGGGGKLAVIGSVAGDRGRASNYAYGAAKGGLATYVAGLRHRLGKKVSITVIKPGFVDTPMTAHIKKGPLFADPDVVGAAIVRSMERGRAECYLPWFWFWIMAIIRNIPDFIFSKMKI
jgi:decaprenylphospho-beta-D-erythro-pentofuranosid-2-ulose 2-reductase